MGKKLGLSAVPGGRPDAAAQATTKAASLVASRKRFRPTGANQVWSLVFGADQVADGRRFRALTVLDLVTRESLATELGRS